MAQPEGPQFTLIAKALAQRLPTQRVPEEGVASAFRDTLYTAQEKGALDPVSRLIEAQGKGDEVVSALAAKIREA